MSREFRRRSAPGPLGRLLVHLLLTALVTWFILRAVGFNLEELASYDLASLDVRWWLVVLSIPALLGAFLFLASLWGLMVREMGGTEVPLVPALRVFFTANLGRYLPGKLWQIAGLAYLARGEGVPAGTATGAAVLGQAFSLAGATLLGAGVFLGVGEGSSALGVGAMALLLVLLVGVMSPGILRRALVLWFRLARQEVPSGVGIDGSFGVRWTGLYALGWAFQGLSFWVLALGLGFPLSPLEAAPAYAAAYVAGYLVLFAPAGVGVREGMLVAFLGPPLGAGAAVLALLARLWSTMVEMIPAVTLGMGYLRSSSRDRDAFPEAPVEGE